MNSGVSGKNRKLLDELARSHQGPFSIKEASKLLNLSENETRIVLAYLGRKGWLSRVKRGLYITVPLGTVNPQEYRGHPWIVANCVFAPCYIAGWSAAEHWELTDQIFNSVVVFTRRKFKSSSINIQGTDFITKMVSQKYFGKTKSAWVENVKISVSDPLQTIVDLLDDPSIGGGMRNIADIVRVYFASQYRNDSEIINYIKARNNRTVYKRLGYLIEKCAIDAPVLREACKKNISAGFSLLDPTVEPRGSFQIKWHLRINVSIDK